MLYLAFQAVKSPQQELTVGAAATAVALGWVLKNTNSTLFLVQPLSADVWVTVDGETTPVVGSVGFCLQTKIPAIFTAGEIAQARFASTGTQMTVQGGESPATFRSAY